MVIFASYADFRRVYIMNYICSPQILISFSLKRADEACALLLSLFHSCLAFQISIHHLLLVVHRYLKMTVHTWPIQILQGIWNQMVLLDLLDGFNRIVIDQGFTTAALLKLVSWSHTSHIVLHILT